MFKTDHIRVEPSSLDAAEVLGAETCELEAGWDKNLINLVIKMSW